jgi:hypothetical protein
MRIRFAHKFTIALSIIGATGCLVPNVMCFEKTYTLSAMMSGNSAVDEDLTPSDVPLSCTSALDLAQVPLEGYVSVVEKVYTSELEVTDQQELQRLDEMMTAIEAGNGSSMPAMHQTEYTQFIETMTTQMHADCVTYLSEESYVSCTEASAELVCNAYVTNPTRAKYLDLDLGETYVRPLSVNSGTQVKGADGWCHYYKNPVPQGQSTDSATDGNEDSSTSGATTPPDVSGDDGSSSADEGSSGGDENEEAPFGSLDTLVHCNDASTSCTYDPALIDNVFAAASVVEADEAFLRLLGSSEAGYPGIRLEGFDRGEPTTELAASVGLREGDIIRSVDGTTLSDQRALSSVLDKLLVSPAGTFVYERSGSTREVRIEPR